MDFYLLYDFSLKNLGFPCIFVAFHNIYILWSI